MLKLKAGVKPEATWAILLAIQVADAVFTKFGYDCVLTSLMDGTHGANSLHTRDGLCRAVDIRTKQVQRQHLVLMKNAISDALGADYDIVLEHLSEEQEHMHIEFDDKDLKRPGGYAGTDQH